MTTKQLEQFEELARRAVVCKRWRWMPGMRTAEGWRVISGPTKIGYLAYDENPENWQIADNYFEGGKIPDLRDPATLGCLLALVREACGDGVYLLPDGGWYVKGARLKNGSSINLGICAATETEALVSALEVAQ